MNKLDHLSDILADYSDLLFDLDNTLYPMEDYDRGAFSDIAMLFPETKGLAEFLYRHKQQHGARYARLFNDAVDKFNLPQAAVSQMVQLYHQHDARFISVDFTYLRLLKKLRNEGHRIFIITNGKLATQRKKIVKLAISELITEIEICDGSPEHPLKPNPAAFIRLTQHYQLSNPVMVGDSMEIDGIFAKNCCIPFVHHSFVKE